MDSKEIVSIISGSKDTIVWLSSILALTLLFLYAKSRAGSTYFIHDRIWRILGGKKSYENPDFQSELLKLSDYEKFNYKTGIRFPSYRNITKTLDWLHSTGIGLEEIIRTRVYFDSRKIEIRKPNITIIKSSYRFALFTVIISSIIFIFSGVPAALLKIKKTGTTIWAYENQITSWNGFSWKVSESECEQNNLPLDEHDRKVICEILLDKESKEYIDHTILMQRITSIALVFLSGFFLFSSIRVLLVAEEAGRLRDRSLRETTQGDGQPPRE